MSKQINISKKRLKHDMKIYKKNPIDNVYVNWNINNLYTPNVIIIGPKNTPYENGFYGIKFKFSNNGIKKITTINIKNLILIFFN